MISRTVIREKEEVTFHFITAKASLSSVRAESRRPMHQLGGTKRRPNGLPQTRRKVTLFFPNSLRPPVSRCNISAVTFTSTGKNSPSTNKRPDKTLTAHHQANCRRDMTPGHETVSPCLTTPTRAERKNVSGSSSMPKTEKRVTSSPTVQTYNTTKTQKAVLSVWTAPHELFKRRLLQNQASSATTSKGISTDTSLCSFTVAV